MSSSINGSGDPDTFACVHQQGDGKLFKYEIGTRFSPPDKIIIINSLLGLIRDRANSEIKALGLHGVGIILNDIAQAPNWQSADKIFADDILCEICELISVLSDCEVVDTVVNSICEQMADMIRSNGTCPSGRVNRLWQIYMFLRDLKDGVHLSKSTAPIIS